MLLKGNSACKDMALRIPVKHEGEDRMFMSCFLHSLANLATAYTNHNKEEMEANEMLKIVVISLLKVLVEWMRNCTFAAMELAGSPTSLFLFNFANGISKSSGDVDTEGLAALTIGHCLVSLGLEEDTKRDTKSQFELRSRLMRTLFKVF